MDLKSLIQQMDNIQQLGEAVKHTASGVVHKADPGGYGRKHDVDDDGEEGTPKAEPVKRGRGRPPKSGAHSVDPKEKARIASREKAAKDLQSFMVGNIPKRGLPGKASVKHKISDKEDVAEGSGMNVVKSVKVGNFRHDLVDTGMGWQVRIYNGDQIYDTGLSKNSEQKGLAALEDAVAYTEKLIRTKRQGVAEGSNGDLVYISVDRVEAFEDWMNSEGLETNVPKTDEGTYVVYDYTNEDHRSKMYAHEWNEKRDVAEEQLDEMDKSAPQPGRDGKVSHRTYGSRDKGGPDYFSGKEAPGKPVTRKQTEKDALDALTGSFKKHSLKEWMKRVEITLNEEQEIVVPALTPGQPAQTAVLKVGGTGLATDALRKTLQAAAQQKTIQVIPSVKPGQTVNQNQQAGQTAAQVPAKPGQPQPAGTQVAAEDGGIHRHARGGSGDHADKLSRLLRNYPHEHRLAQEGWGMHESLYQALCDHYWDEGRIPRDKMYGSRDELRDWVEECYGQDTMQLVENPLDPHAMQMDTDNAAMEELVDESAVAEEYVGHKKLSSQLKDKGAKDPEALASWIGRKKYGKSKFQKAAAAGKKLGEDSHILDLDEGIEDIKRLSGLNSNEI